MAERKTVEKKRSRAPREEPSKADRDDEDTDGGEELGLDAEELASYLEERIKPGLNRGAIPLLARSIARELAGDAQRGDEDEDEDEDEDGAAADLEADLHTLQQFLGEEWTLFYAVNGGDAWLAAENEDATQRVEAPTADVLIKAVTLLKEGGGRSKPQRSEPDDDDGDEDGD